jgi:integrase
MAKAKRKESRFPHVKGLAVKRTKFGQRYVLTEPDSTGKSRSITVKVLDTDTLDVFYKKVSDARARLRSRNAGKTFKELIEDYCVIHQLAEGTKKGYQFILRGFSFNDRSNTKLVCEILQSGKKYGTLKGYVSKINSFYEWLIKRGEQIKNPVADVVLKGSESIRSRTFTDDEMNKMLEYASRKEPMYYLFILLLVNTGARCSTISVLRRKDLDKQGYLHLYNVKGKKPYDYPIPLKDATAKRLMQENGPELWQGKEVAYRDRLNHWLRRNFGKDANGEHLTPHSIRHTFATNALRNGVPLEVISKLLDHRSISITLRVYAKFSTEQIDDAVEKAIKKPT